VHGYREAPQIEFPITCRTRKSDSCARCERELMSDQISEKVMSIVASVKQIPPEAVSIHKTFKEPGSDSRDAIDIMSCSKTHSMLVSLMSKSGLSVALQR